MARAYKDGAGSSYNGSTSTPGYNEATGVNQFQVVPFGKVMADSTNPGAGQIDNGGKFFEIFSYGADSGAGQTAYKQKVDNSNAGVLRDCAECHVGGGMNEYVYANMSTSAYKPHERASLRTFDFGTAVTAWNYFIDIFNTDLTKRGDVVKQDYSQTGVLEMDCLMCHQNGYDWAARKETVRAGEFDASRAVGAKLVNGVANGLSVFYNYTTVKTNASGKLVIDLSASLKSKPESANCANCHQSQYQVDWKKRGEQWLRGSEVHYGMGCMACHERKDKDINGVPTNVGTTGLMSEAKLGLCDPAKGGASDFDAMWNKMDTVSFKECSDCHEPADKITKEPIVPTWPTYGAPASVSAHAAKGLTAKIAFDKSGNPISHMELIDCTACHISKDFDGGAMVDGTGADEEGRVALHDEQQVAREMGGTAGNALYWNNGKLYAANLLTSSFVRDMNGMDAGNFGFDGNNDGRNAGMDTLLQTHVNDLNNAVGAHAVAMHPESDGSWTNEAEVSALFARIAGDSKGTASTGTGTYPGGLKQLLGISDANNDYKLIPKMSFLMVPFKASHNIARTATHAWGKGGCADCHADNAGFYNGAYPIKGNMDGFDNSGTNFKYRFMSNQVSPFTKVNGLADVTDSHPNVVTKKGDRSVPIPILTKFNGPYVKNEDAEANQTLRNIDRSEVIYEKTFQTRDTAWKTVITGAAPAASCTGPTSPFFCATPTGNSTQDAVKSKATSTKGWLLKVEIKDDAVAGGVRFRTAQLSKDNATTMTEVLDALPPSFKLNDDFSVTASDPSPVLNPTTGGALTITALNGHEIRLSKQTDGGPLGLKGAIWKSDPIKRGGATVAVTRDDYVAYLNNVPTDLAAYGIGVNPVAAMARISDISNVQLGTQVEVAKTVAISALDAQTGGTVSYKWSALKPGTCTDIYNVTTACLVDDDDAPIDAVFADANAQTTTVTFGSTGNKIIKLTVTDEEGKTSTATAEVTAIVAPINIGWAAGTPAGTPLKYPGVATFSKLPAGVKSVKVAWGDGLTTIKKDQPVEYITKDLNGKETVHPAAPLLNVDGDVVLAHTYASAGTRYIKLFCYDVDGKQIGYQQMAIIP